MATLDLDLENARPVPTRGVKDGDMVDFGWRPIFKEHVNRKSQRFGRQAMERIAERCNKRIRDTGDFCPITIRHTTDDGSRDPEVIGAFGPFRAQKMPGENGKWAVYARERIYEEDAGKRKKYPRVSVEYWADEEDPTGGYFDPASLLGAETPELDLGMHYSADPADPRRTLMRYQRVIRYEAEPGGSNTSPAAMVEEDPERYQAGGTLSEADLLQIITALKPTIQEAVSAAVKAQSPVGADPDGLLTDEAPESPLGAMPEGMPTDDAGAEPFAEGDDAAMGGAEAEPEIDGLDESPAEPSVDLPAEPDGDEAEPDGDEPAPKKPVRHSRLNALETTEDSDMATEAEVQRYQKEASDYRKKAERLEGENRDLRSKYQKSESKLAEVTTELEEVRSRERKAVRYQKLGELQNQGFTFDVDEEFKDCEDLNDAQFDRHCERISQRYQRVPGGLAANGVKLAGPARTGADDEKAARKRDRYSKQAMDNVMASRTNPDPKQRKDFKEEFERLMAEDPEKIGQAA